MIQKLILGTTLLGSALAFWVFKGYKNRQLRDMDKAYNDLATYYLESISRLTESELVEHTRYLIDRLEFDQIVSPGTDYRMEITRKLKAELDSILYDGPNSAR